MIEVRKKKKHIQTALTRKKANGETRGAPSDAAGPCASAGASRPLRSASTAASEENPTAAAAQAAVRQPAAAAMPVMNTGAAAQPMLPASPCAENACPSLAGETLRF